MLLQERRGEHTRRSSYFLETGQSESVQAAFSNFKVARLRLNEGQIVQWMRIGLACLLLTLFQSRKGHRMEHFALSKQLLCSLIDGLDESSGARPGETASAWGGTGSGSGYGASHLCVFWADSQMGGAALPQEEDFPLYVQESREVRCRV